MIRWKQAEMGFPDFGMTSAIRTSCAMREAYGAQRSSPVERRRSSGRCSREVPRDAGRAS